MSFATQSLLDTNLENNVIKLQPAISIATQTNNFDVVDSWCFGVLVSGRSMAV